MTTESATALIGSGTSFGGTSGPVSHVINHVDYTESYSSQETLDRSHVNQMSGEVTVKYYGTIPSFTYNITQAVPVGIDNMFHQATVHLQEQLRIITGKLEGLFPATIPLFGLINEDHTNWLCSSSSLKSTKTFCYYRFRLRLTEDNSYKKLCKMDHFVCTYLFVQCRDDFINGRLTSMYSQKMLEKMLGFVAMDLLIPQSSHDYKTAKKKHLSESKATGTYDPLANFNLFTLLRVLPKQSRKYFRLPWRYLMLYFNLRHKLSELQSSHQTKGNIQLFYIMAVFRDVPEYCMETYKGYLISSNFSAEESNFKLYKISPIDPGTLYENEDIIGELPDVICVGCVKESTGVEDCVKIIIIFEKKKPLVIKFAEEDGLSFASVLSTYYKVMVDYHSPLVDDMRDSSLPIGLNSFGPMEREKAVCLLQEKLKTFMKTNATVRCVFLIRQRCHLLNSFELISYNVNQEKFHYTIAYDGGHYLCTVRPEESFNEVELIEHFKQLHGRQIKPERDNPSCEVWIKAHLFPKRIQHYYQKDMTGFNAKAKDPQLIKDSEIVNLSETKDGRDKYTSITKVEIMSNKEEKFDMIQLKEKTISISNVPTSECLHKLAGKLSKLQHRSFVLFYGITVDPPLCLFVDHSPHGDLCHFIQTYFKEEEESLVNGGTSDDNREEISLLQFITTSASIADGLDFLSTKHLIHGNLRCENIQVYGLTNAQIDVRIGDPGLVEFYNKHSLSQLFNIERIPWIAVELFNKLDDCTIESEVYSFGTLLWEFFSYGRKPDIANVDINNIMLLQDFFKSGKQLTKPASLEESPFILPFHNDIRRDLWKLMGECWNLQPEDRPITCDIIPKLRRMVSKFGDFVEKEVDINKLKGNSQEILLPNSIRKNQLVMKERLGEGHYGIVSKAKYFEDINYKHNYKYVAIKQLKEDISTLDKETKKTNYKSFNDEVNVMQQLDHEHVVRVIGVCYEGSMMLVMEFVSSGSLIKWLKTTSDNTVNEHSWRISREIAYGMVYLSSKKILHRDLAARNILLDDNLHVKITDFGLAKCLDEKEYYKSRTMKSLPLWWTAPECFSQNYFSTKTDVWSYGVVLWEIYTYGKQPTLNSIITSQTSYVDTLRQGKRFTIEENWPLEIKDVLSMCWDFDCNKRPNFDNILLLIQTSP